MQLNFLAFALVISGDNCFALTRLICVEACALISSLIPLHLLYIALHAILPSPATKSVPINTGRFTEVKTEWQHPR
jgi:hypothetical protein